MVHILKSFKIVYYSSYKVALWLQINHSNLHREGILLERPQVAHNIMHALKHVGSQSARS